MSDKNFIPEDIFPEMVEAGKKALRSRCLHIDDDTYDVSLDEIVVSIWRSMMFTLYDGEVKSQEVSPLPVEV